MSYFIFDMDETLAELYSVYYFIANLKVAEIYDEMPLTLEKSLKKAYRLFVLNVLIEELSSSPLGILRPGILNVMKQLYELQKTGKIAYVVIYSNNSHLQSLEFIRDMIHKYLDTNNLIKDCLHWNHHMRIEETKSINQPTKTWNVLKNILVMGNCKASKLLQQKDVYFFDDQDHTDLQKNLGINYYKVPPYSFKASYDRIADIYIKCLKNIDIEEYNNIIADVFSIKSADSLDTILEEFKRRTGQTNNGVPPPPDRGIEVMLEAIMKMQQQSGGKRQRAKTKKRKSIEHILQKKLKSK